MLTHLELTHFKCFKSLKLPIRPVTLLSGWNASGKSSVLQALALLHQTAYEREWASRLLLNGSTVELGTVADVVDELEGHRTFEISLVDTETFYSWTFEDERDQRSMNVVRVQIDGQEANLERLRFLVPPESIAEGSLAERLRGLTYLTAERLGPRSVYELEDRRDFPVVGPDGRNAISLLYWGGLDRVLPELRLDGTPPTRSSQVAARMAAFFPGFSLDIDKIPQAQALTLGLRTSDASSFYSPVHAGFGLTQVMPIVIAALSADVEDILLIENPEVHLHPAGQAMMGYFLAEVASAGVQVILETHSDHVLSGLRRAVKGDRLAADQVAIHFFRPRTSNNPQVSTLAIDPSGNIDDWPEGFFDQFEKDAAYMAGWGP